MPLRLDLLRHGEALPAETGDDAARPLSEAGRRAAARIAEEYARRRWRPERVFTSPLLWARETADIVIARAHPGLEPEAMEELLPSHDPEDVVDALSDRRAGGHVLLVGHQPLLGKLAVHLTGGAEPRLSPGGLASVEIEELPGRRTGRLLQVLHPDHLP